MTYKLYLNDNSEIEIWKDINDNTFHMEISDWAPVFLKFEESELDDLISILLTLKKDNSRWIQLSNN
jgi:hypothetical protein